MGKIEKKLMGISKMLAVIVIAAIIIIAAVGGAYWWFYLRPAPPTGAITCSVSPDEVEPGESITVSGSTSPARADATVTLIYTKPDGSSFNRTVTTDSNGKFTDTYSSATTDPTGKWAVIAKIEGETSDPAAFYIFVSPPVKIGVIRNLLLQGQGMEEGAKLAAEEINDAGGVLGRKVVLCFGDEGTEPATGTAEMERLITVEKVHFLIGGFRTEIVKPMKETAMDYKKIFIITGASTTELLNCWGSLTEPIPCHHCVRDNYDRYKYLFRVMPPNSSLLFSGCLVPFVKGYMLPEVFHGTEESPVKIAGVIEDLTWTAVLDYMFRTAPTLVTGLKGHIVYYARPSATETDFTAILSAIRDSGAKIIIHVFSGEAGLAFIKQWGEMQVPAIPIGVNVLGQESDHWDKTAGECEYETMLSSPPKVNISETTLPFWNKYVTKWGHDPMYTSFGTYDGILGLAEAIEDAGTLDSDAVVAEFEKSVRISTMGMFKFTVYHDVFVEPMYNVDLYGNYQWLSSIWAKPLIVQWLSPGERRVVLPFNETYTTQIQLPPWM